MWHNHIYTASPRSAFASAPRRADFTSSTGTAASELPVVPGIQPKVRLLRTATHCSNLGAFPQSRLIPREASVTSFLLPFSSRIFASGPSLPRGVQTMLSEARQALPGTSTDCQGARVTSVFCHCRCISTTMPSLKKTPKVCSLLHVKVHSGVPWEKVCVGKHFTAWELHGSQNTAPQGRPQPATFSPTIPSLTVTFKVENDFLHSFPLFNQMVLNQPTLHLF